MNICKHGNKIIYYWPPSECPTCIWEKKMSCKCKNPDGTLAEKCCGTCKSELQILQSQMASLVYEIANLPQLMIETKELGYKRGFKEGFEVAKDIYE